MKETYKLFTYNSCIIQIVYLKMKKIYKLFTYNSCIVQIVCLKVKKCKNCLLKIRVLYKLSTASAKIRSGYTIVRYKKT